MEAEQVIFTNIYVYAYIHAIIVTEEKDLSLKESREEYVKGFEKRMETGEM